MSISYDASARSLTERRMAPSERLLAAGALLESVARAMEVVSADMADLSIYTGSHPHTVPRRLDGLAKLLKVIAGSIAVNVPRLPSTSTMDAARAEIVRLQSLLETRA